MWYDIFRERSFFVCLYEAGTSQYTTEAYTMFSFIFLGSYSPSTLASLVHSDFSVPLSLKPSSPPRPVPRTAFRLLYPVLCSRPTSPGLKTSVVICFLDAHVPRGYFSLQYLIHAIHVAFPLSFVYLKTQVHPVFVIHKLISLSKVKYSILCIWQRKA